MGEDRLDHGKVEVHESTAAFAVVVCVVVFAVYATVPAYAASNVPSVDRKVAATTTSVVTTCRYIIAAVPATLVPATPVVVAAARYAKGGEVERGRRGEVAPRQARRQAPRDDLLLVPRVKKGLINVDAIVVPGIEERHDFDPGPQRTAADVGDPMVRLQPVAHHDRQLRRAPVLEVTPDAPPMGVVLWVVQIPRNGRVGPAIALCNIRILDLVHNARRAPCSARQLVPRTEQSCLRPDQLGGLRRPLAAAVVGADAGGEVDADGRRLAVDDDAILDEGQVRLQDPEMRRGERAESEASKERAGRAGREGESGAGGASERVEGEGGAEERGGTGTVLRPLTVLRGWG